MDGMVPWYGKDGWLEMLGILYYILYDMKRKKHRTKVWAKKYFLGETKQT